MPELCKIGLDPVLPDTDRLTKYRNMLESNTVFNRYDYVTVNGLPIHVNLYWRRIGVNLSGGADSAILFYILARMFHELDLEIDIVPICVTRYWRQAQHVEDAKQFVYDRVLREFPQSRIQPILWGFIPSAYEVTPIENINFNNDERRRWQNKMGKANSDVYFFQEFNSWIYKKHQIDRILSGTTTNPIQATMPGAPAFRDGDQEDLDLLQFSWPKDSPEFVTTYDPFGVIEKSWTTAQFINFGIQDLFDATKSCENEVNGCGNCFHCHERSWSLENCGKYVNV